MLEAPRPAGNGRLDYYPAGAWTDEQCLNGLPGSGGQAFQQWTDAELLIPRYLGEFNYQAEHDSSQDESKLDNGKGDSNAEQQNGSPTSDPTGTHYGEEPEKPAAKSKASSKVKRWKNRTPKQHWDNILAQRRYRQRKKAKVEGLRQQIEELTETLQHLQTDPVDLQHLEQCNQEYEQQLWSVHAEVRQLQEQLAKQAVQCQKAQPSYLQAKALGKNHQQQLECAAHEYLAQTLELAKLLDKLGQEPAATDDTLSPKNAQDINSTMLHVMDLCRWALSLGDLDINKLIDCAEDSALGRGHTAVSSDESPNYTQISNKLSLSSDQQDKAVQLWQQVSCQMRGIWSERRSLHQEWVHTVQQQHAPQCNGTSNGNSISAVALQLLVSKLEQNLKSEQRAYCQQHHMVFRQLLSHTQGGWLVVLAYPHHCDCYAFLRAVAKAQGALDVVHDSEAMQS